MSRPSGTRVLGAPAGADGADAAGDGDAHDAQPDVSDGGGRSLPCAFGAFMLERRLGGGGMGEIYVARQRVGAIERPCVVKMVRPELASSAMAAQRFVAEARTSALLSHKNLATVHDVGFVDGTPYIAIEYIHGRDLLAVHRRAQRMDTYPISERIARQIFIELLDALAYVHRALDPRTGLPLDVVHRDVSLHNVMLADDGAVKLIDFGIARSAANRAHFGGELTQAGQLLGKIRYMAPEQARGERVDGRADVFAAAVIVAELATGRRFYGTTPTTQLWLDVAAGKLPSLDLSRLSPAFADAIRAGLHPSREARPTAAALKERVRATGDGVKSEELRALLEQLFPPIALVDETSTSGTALMTLHTADAVVAGDLSSVTAELSPAPATMTMTVMPLGSDNSSSGSSGSARNVSISSMGTAVVAEREPTPTHIVSKRGRPAAAAAAAAARRSRILARDALAAMAAALAFMFAAVVLATSSPSPTATAPPAAAPSASTRPAAAPSASTPPASAGLRPMPVVVPTQAPVVVEEREPALAVAAVEPRVEQREPEPVPRAERSAPVARTRGKRERAPAAPTAAAAASSSTSSSSLGAAEPASDPPLLGELVRQLRKCSARASCAPAVLARAQSVAELSLPELQQLESDVKRCLARCSR